MPFFRIETSQCDFSLGDSTSGDFTALGDPILAISCAPGLNPILAISLCSDSNSQPGACTMTAVCSDENAKTQRVAKTLSRSKM